MLVYDGALPQTVFDWLKSAIDDGYSFVVETNGLVQFDSDQLLKERTWTHESQDGACWERTGSLYWTCTISLPTENDGHRFYGFVDEDDRQRFIRAFPERIVNPNPIKTVLQ